MCKSWRQHSRMSSTLSIAICIDTCLFRGRNNPVKQLYAIAQTPLIIVQKLVILMCGNVNSGEQVVWAPWAGVGAVYGRVPRRLPCGGLGTVVPMQLIVWTGTTGAVSTGRDVPHPHN